MVNAVPLIRAAALAPVLRWMRERGLDADSRLRSADLLWCPWGDPYAPIPLVPAARLLRDLARDEGPDLPWRIAEERAFFELGLLRDAGLRSDTPAGVLSGAAAAMPMHCTHETFVVLPREPSGLAVRDGWLLAFDDETLHVVQQYVAGIVDMVCGLAGAPAPRLESIRLTAHPEHGVEHLRPWLGDRIAAGRDRFMEIVVRGEVADAALSADAVEAALSAPMPVAAVEPLSRNWRTSWGVEVLLKGMLQDGGPSIDRVARAAGMSRRSLQRRLAEEGASFSDLLEGVRAETALSRIREGGMPLGRLAADLGYARQSTLSRALRRWNGDAPGARRRKP